MGKIKRWIVTTSGDRLLSDITKDLTKKGLTIVQVLDEIGCIIVDASDDSAEQLRTVPGIADVSPNAPIDIGPPDSDVTW
jgi:hypothetical protein